MVSLLLLLLLLVDVINYSVTHVEEISLDYNQYPGYEFSPPPNQEGIISLSTNGWLTVICPISPQYPLNFAIKRNLKLTQFQTKIPGKLHQLYFATVINIF